MRKIGSVFLMLAFIISFMGIASADDVRLVASQNSDRYHRADCKIAKKILKEDLVPDLKAPEEYLAAGYNPCKKCNPPTKNKKAGS